jgi:hypothetical protein
MSWVPGRVEGFQWCFVFSVSCRHTNTNEWNVGSAVETTKYLTCSWSCQAYSVVSRLLLQMTASSGWSELLWNSPFRTNSLIKPGQIKLALGRWCKSGRVFDVDAVNTGWNLGPVTEVKGKSDPATCHGGAWGKRRYSSYSFLTSTLDGGEWLASRPGRALPPGKGSPVPIG